MRGLLVKGKVTHKGPIDMRSQSKAHAMATITDETGEILLNLWRDQIEQVQIGLSDSDVDGSGESSPVSHQQHPVDGLVGPIGEGIGERQRVPAARCRRGPGPDPEQSDRAAQDESGEDPERDTAPHRMSVPSR